MTLKSANAAAAKKKKEDTFMRESGFDNMTTLKQEEGKANVNAKYLDIDSLQPHPANRDATHGIEELAQSIYEMGLLDPLRVTKDVFSGKHYIISGERRWRALNSLKEKYPEEIKYQFAPCELSPAASDLDIKAEIHCANMERENPTIEEFRKAVEELSADYDAAIEREEEIPEKKKAFIKRMLGTRGLSERQLRRYATIVTKSTPELQEAVKAQKVNLKLAEEMAVLDAESQLYLLSLMDSGNKVNSETVSQFKEVHSKYRESRKELEEVDGPVTVQEKKKIEKKKQKLEEKEKAELEKSLGKKKQVTVRSQMKSLEKNVRALSSFEKDEINDDIRRSIEAVIETLRQLIEG